MRLLLQIIGVIVLHAVLGFLVFQSFDQGGLLKWNRWVSRVQLAGQAGSDEQTVIDMLGKPTSVKDIYKIPKTGVSPKPLPPPQAKKVYTYSRLSARAGYWVAYVFIDQSGKVVGVHLATS